MPADKLTAIAYDGTRETWDAIAHAHGTAFHLSDWLDVLESQQPARMRRLALIHRNQLVGIVPLAVKSYFGPLVGASPFRIDNTPYLGVACEQRFVRAALAAVGDFGRANRLALIRLIQSERLPDDARSDAFSYESKYTHVLDLSRREETLWSGLEGRCRTAVRKAHKAGVVVSVEPFAEAMTEYFGVLAELYRRQHMPLPNSLEFHQALGAKFGERGLSLLTARVDGKMIAGATILCHGAQAYYLTGASLAEYLHLSPNNALQWESIRHAQRQGATRYDFVGSNIPRLSNFKKSFGGTSTEYTYLEQATSRWAQSLREFYPRARGWIERSRRPFR